MGVVIGGLTLVVAAWLIRRVLRMDANHRGRHAAYVPLTPERQAIYTPISMEVETQVVMLSILLNDAIEERDSAHPEIAWRLVTLSSTGWDRVAEIITTLLDTLQKNISQTRAAVPYRGMVARRYKSQCMIDYLRMHELLDQLVFRSRMRFHLQVHTLRKATATLSMEFHRAYGYGDRSEDRPPELWRRLDIYAHDFDLVSKEALMAFRAFLICLPHSALKTVRADLEPALRRGVRTPSVHVET
jgi:hypothetical protein